MSRRMTPSSKSGCVTSPPADGRWEIRIHLLLSAEETSQGYAGSNAFLFLCATYHVQ